MFGAAFLDIIKYLYTEKELKPKNNYFGTKRSQTDP